MIYAGASSEWPKTRIFNKRDGQWFRNLRDIGWIDASRHLQGDQRVDTWHAPQFGTGFRLDQAFVNAPALRRLAAVCYDWGDLPRGALIDHAALILDLDGRIHLTGRNPDTATSPSRNTAV